MVCEDEKVSEVIKQGDKELMGPIRTVIDSICEAISPELREKIDEEDGKIKEHNKKLAEQKKRQEQKEKALLKQLMKENSKLKQLLEENNIKF